MYYYIKKFKVINFSASLILVIISGISVLMNFVMMEVFEGIIDRDLTSFVFWLVLDLVGWLIYLILDCFQTYLQAKAISKMNNQLRKDISATLLQKKMMEYHSSDQGEYLSWYTNHVNEIQKNAWIPFYNMIRWIASVFWCILGLAYLHWSLLIATILVSVILLFLPNLFKNKMEILGKNCAQAQATAVSRWKDLLAGYNVLQFFGLGIRFMKQSSEASENMESEICKKTTKGNIYENIMSIINVTLQLVINIMIGFLSIQGVIIQSALFGAGNICGTVTNGIKAISDCRLTLAGAKPYFKMITVHADDQKNLKFEEITFKSEIQIQNLNFNYGEKNVLSNLNLIFEKGKKYALSGPSGCGKSTVLKIIMGWLTDYTGQVLIDDKDRKEYDTRQIQHIMAYIEQDVFLFNTTIYENITLGQNFSKEEVDKAVHDSALEADLIQMPQGLQTMVGENGSALSGGQKQRVAIARALIYKRSILLIDEGTSALDQKNADLIEECLLKNPELTLILISHHLTEDRKMEFDQIYDLS